MRCKLILVLALLFYAPLQGQSPTWRLVEELRIGSLDGPLTLSPIVQVLTRRDLGEVYLSQAGVPSVWVLDNSSGRKVREIGRGGEGPGEFSFISGIGWRADTLSVVDPTLMRVSLFTTDGQHVRTVQSTRAVLPETGVIPTPVAFTPAGILAYSNVPSRPRADGTVTTSPLVLVNGEAVVVRTGHSVDLRNTTAMAPVGPVSSAVTFFGQPMSHRNFFGIDPRGESVVVVHQPVGADEPGRFQVVRTTAPGDTLYSRVYRYTPIEVSAELTDSLYRRPTLAFSALLSSQERGREAARRYVTVPRVHPPISSLRGRLLVAEDGSVWLRREDVGSGQVTWLVLNAEGLIQANVRTPATLHLLHIDDRIVWGEVTGEFDEPYLVRFRIEN